MNYYSYGWIPRNTSKTLVFLIGCLTTISIFSSLIDGIFVYFFNMNGPQTLLSLSWYGLSQGYIWQPISYLFVLSSGNAGMSLGFFLELLFSIYIIWIMGSNLIARIGSSPFFRFYFITGSLVGLFTIILMPVIHQYTALAGPTSSLIAIITVWTMLLPESELLLFFMLPFKAKWLFTSMLGILLLIHLSHFNLIFFFYDLFSVLAGYLYATLVWELKSPFEITSRVDELFISLGKKIRLLKIRGRSLSESAHPSADRESKIYDFHTGNPVLDDDAFMDQILDKISKFGERSLSWSERSRMHKISEKKSKTRER